MRDVKLRQYIYQVMHQSSVGNPRIAQYFDIGIIVLIILNIIAIVFESIESVYAAYETGFIWFERFSVLVFTTEYLLRVWSCVESSLGQRAPWLHRLRYILSPMALIDLIAILPFYLSMFFALDLRFLRVLRVLRIFKLTRYSYALSVLLSVMQEESKTFLAAVFILIIVLVCASSGIYVFEHQAQPEAFGSIPGAVWWAVTTITTVGYGDVTPITIGGKLFAMCIMIAGVGMVALPSGILASAFTEKLRQRRTEYRMYVDEVLQDGYISDEESALLERMRESLNLSQADAELLYSTALRDMLDHHVKQCPHCGKNPFRHLDEETE